VDAEKDAALVARCPILYRDRHGDMRATCMAFGFECGPGWDGIIERLSEQLEFISNNSPVEVVATQVKEKFGGLRFYHYVGGDEADPTWYSIVNALIDGAEGRSYHTCEDCGKWGQRREGGWIRTLCDDCQSARETRRETRGSENEAASSPKEPYSRPT
jgi:hypothetical protein